MITQLEIKNIASFDSDGISFEDMKKINFIYGENGSGKTTISKLLMDPTTPSPYLSVKWKGEQPIRTLVYNKEFRRLNFQKGKIKGVFTLGEASAEEQALIETEREKLEQIKQQGIDQKKQCNKLEQDKAEADINLRDYLWDNVYKKNETKFKDAFTGFQRKETFKTKALLVFEQNLSSDKTLDDLLSMAKVVFGRRPEVLELLPSIGFDKISQIEEDLHWSKIIVGKDDVEIAPLIQQLQSNDWVNKGRIYLRDDSEVCPFCQQNTISSDFRMQLEQYFDETYIRNLAKIHMLTEQYNEEIGLVLNSLLQLLEKEKNNKNTKLDLDKFAQRIKAFENTCRINQDQMYMKCQEPSRRIQIEFTKELQALISDLLKLTNEDIKKHNQIAEDYTEKRKVLIDDIWCYIIAENRKMISGLYKKLNGLEKVLNVKRDKRELLLKEYSTQENKINELVQNLTNTQTAILQINQTLKLYGFTSFEIQAASSDNQYQIVRSNGEVVESSLSEGEITFITFLYFLQLAKGGGSREEISEDRILIVDDPISSLDSNVLFVVSSLLKEIIKDVKTGRGYIKQLIVFTHNVYFHKEISYVNGRSEDNADNSPYFWMLRKDHKTTIEFFGKENPIKNSYDLLWAELRDRKSSSLISIQNTMRRIIENYFKLLGRYKDDHIIQAFETKVEQEICRSLICWINDGSHSLSDDLFLQHPESTIEKYMLVFEQIFQKMGHIEHYQMMMQTHNN